MNKLVKIVFSILMLLLAGVGVLALSVHFLPSSEVPLDTGAKADPLAEEAPFVVLDAGSVAEGELLVFNFTLDDFIESYNGVYWQAEGARYLLDKEKWQVAEVEETVQSQKPATVYSYRFDTKKWTLPELRVTVPEGAEAVEEVAVCYDEHSFSEATYALFEEDCYYTLKTFFPELDEETLTTIVETVNQSAYDHTFPSVQQYRAGTAQLPALLYHSGGIGVFGYFAIGAPVHFCVIPVDDALLANYTASGVEVREIEG